MKTLKAIVVSPILIAIAIGSNIAAQQPVKEFRNQINRKGWAIPGLSQSRVVGRRGLVQNEQLKSHWVYVTRLEPTHEVVTTVFFYTSMEDSTLLVTPSRLAVRSVLRFDVANKVFCYGIRAVGAFYNPKLKKGGYGGEYTLFYYDDDGDGLFERMQDIGDPVSIYSPVVPKWALHPK